MDNDFALRFPVGYFRYADSYTPEATRAHIADIAAFPAQLREEAGNLTEEELARTYRPGSWTVRQVIHHLVDSHINAFLRVKSALTEDVPVIRGYDQDAWSALPDAALPPEASFAALDGIHARFAALLGSLDAAGLARRFYHPENKRLITLEQTAAAYSWHGRHHLGHILLALGRK